ncbi:MAG: hypothetical protein ACWA5R_04075 [bacterium]
MKKLSWLLRVVGVIQLILGVLYLFAPDMILQSMGHSTPQTDLHYPLAMLASRFIAVGLVFIYLGNKPEQAGLWIKLMIIIQAIDLTAGIFYTASSVVSLELSGFAMFNASWIALLLFFWRPAAENSES